MDISDGLSKDLSRLLALNKCGISWFKNLMIIRFIAEKNMKFCLLLMKRASKYKNNSQKHGVKLNIFGKAVKGKYELEEENTILSLCIV